MHEPHIHIVRAHTRIFKYFAYARLNCSVIPDVRQVISLSPVELHMYYENMK